MCGRIALYTPPSRLARILDARLDPTAEAVDGPSWNVAPSRRVLALVGPRPGPAQPEGQPGRLLVAFQWGLVPAWARDPSIGNRMINARAETLATKPSFRTVLGRHRCLVVADGFYEWRADPAGGRRRQPFFFRRADGRPLLFAGLWERWHDPERPEDELRTCTIVTTDAGPDVAFVHDRMPVVVEPDEADRWLDRSQRDPGAVTDLLRPAPAGVLVSRPVGTSVNDPRRDGPELLDPPEAPVAADRLFEP